MTVIKVSQMCAINKRFYFSKCYYSASDHNDVKTGKIKIGQSDGTFYSLVLLVFHYIT